MKKIKKFILLTVSLFLLYGCGIETALLVGLGAGGGVAGYKYLEGHASRDYPFSYSKAWDVTNTALENLEISISKSDNNDNKGTIKALQKDGKKITIKLRERGQWVTTISVRAGKIDNPAAAEKVLDEIASVAGL